MTQYHILVVAKDRLARSGLAAFVAETENYKVVGQSTGAEDLAEDIELNDPDLILYDLGWNPVSVVNTLKNSSDYDVPVIVLVPDEDGVREVNTALMGGGSYGLLLRDGDTNMLAAAMESVLNGLIVIDPSIAQEIMQTATSATGDVNIEPLTAREDQVLQLLARGLTNKAIAQSLDITDHTVKFHVTAIMGKLSAQSRTDAVVRATRLGLIIL
jgi:two-component system, NarL family, nitrate/nitrite response regulator NarL